MPLRSTREAPTGTPLLVAPELERGPDIVAPFPVLFDAAFRQSPAGSAARLLASGMIQDTYLGFQPEPEAEFDPFEHNSRTREA
jgi:hypothetical protein